LRHFQQELDALKAKLLEMSAIVENSIYRSVQAVMERNEELARHVLANEARVNQLEIEIDEDAIRLIALQQPVAADLRLITVAVKINNDLERMGDLAVNVSERAVSLAGMGAVQAPPELEPMTTAVRAMVSKCLGALIYQNVELATQVLESDEIVDQHRDQVFETLLAGMTEDPSQAAPNLQFVLASRSLERMADHTTNIAEDVLFWVRGLEVRHGRAKQLEQNAEIAAAASAQA
jgi:phosphate transport system protein